MNKEKQTIIRNQLNWAGDDSLGSILANGTYRYKITTEFDNTTKTKEGTITIEGVAVVCSDCAGTGKISCSTCEGDGGVACNTCGARGWVTCSVCEGSGNCQLCGGKGWYWTEIDRFTCDDCGGTGACPNCNGTAGVDCGTCGGDGSINCPTCGGDGRL